MLKVLARCALFSFVLLPAAAAAEPIKLKMAYFSSDRTTTYLAAIKPFVDAVNADASGPSISTSASAAVSAKIRRSNYGWCSKVP